jgi:hypothetical protein
MPRVLANGKPIEGAYEPPPPPSRHGGELAVGEGFVTALSQAILTGFRNMPPPVINVEAPVMNVPKPEVKINSPVYVQPPEIKIPASTVNLPDQKAPIVNIEPAAVTLQTNRPNEWEFTVIKRNEYGQVVTIRAKAIL